MPKTDKHEHFDAIIVGAGPAGLLLGRELSKKHNILVLEQNKLGETTKTWCTYEDRWKKAGLPQSFIRNRFNSWHALTPYEGEVRGITIKDDFVAFDEHKFLKYLGRQVRKQGSRIYEKTKFKKYSRTKEGEIHVNGKYSTPLLIDCAGVDSPLIEEFERIELPSYINCISHIVEIPRLKNYNYYTFGKHKNGPNFAFGVTKIAPNLGHLLYFQYTTHKEDPRKYKKDLYRVEKEQKVPKYKHKTWKVASYPTGRLKTNAADNIFFFGDAGFYAPPLNGMGFNAALRHYKEAARHLSKCIKKKTYTEKDLRLDKPVTQINNLAFLIPAVAFNSLSPKFIFEVFEPLAKFPQSKLVPIMRNTLKASDIPFYVEQMPKMIDEEQLKKTMKKADLKQMLDVIGALTDEIAKLEIENKMGKKQKVKDMYN